MKRHYYIAYDGRAMFDTDDACVLEAIGEQFTRRAYRDWSGYDAVLVEYDIEGESDLVNENVIGHWHEGFKALRARCAP